MAGRQCRGCRGGRGRHPERGRALHVRDRRGRLAAPLLGRSASGRSSTSWAGPRMPRGPKASPQWISSRDPSPAWCRGTLRAGGRPSGRTGGCSPRSSLPRPIRHAEEGFPLTHRGAAFFAEHRASLTPAAAAVFYPGWGCATPGNAPRAPAIGRTLRRLVADGPDQLYRGELGQRLCEAVQAAGGGSRREDLAAFEPEWIYAHRLHLPWRRGGERPAAGGRDAGPGDAEYPGRV